MTTQDSYCTFIVLSYVDNNGETVQVVTCNELATSVKTRVSILAFGKDDHQYLATNCTKYIKQHSYSINL